ncbi:MAG: ABC-F family ATP-binding cassette domain-containing protein, partial [Pseudomonadota bacterium]
TDDALIDIVLAADVERTELLKRSETETDPNAIADIQTRLVDIDAWSAEARAAQILAGLGFESEAQKRPARSFSGGWRMRVALAAILFSEPDLLLLDEPTNYLDLEGTLWLQNYLARYPRTAIVISHDRDLLNSSVDTILHLDRKKLTLYTGNYDNFERMRAEKAMQQGKAAEKQAAQRAHLEAFVERFRAKASKAKQAQSRLKMLERMESVGPVVETSVAPLHFPAPDKQLSSPIINMEGAATGYGDTKVLAGINTRIDQDDRIALLGANGNGKSTFAKLLCDRLDVMGGRVTRADKLRIGMFAQHQLDDLHADETPVDHVRRLMPSEPEGKVRARVARMGLTTEKMDTKAKDLSGGEKARLLMGLVTFDKPHMLILDEPTNHLDIDTRAALVQALNDYEGAVILISHDRHLIEATMDRLWIVRNGTLERWDGDMDDYRRELLRGPQARQLAESAQEDSAEAAPQHSINKAERRKMAAELRKQHAPLKKLVDQLETKIDKLRDEMQQIDERLGDPGIFERDPEKAQKLTRQRGQAEAQLAETEETWMAKYEEWEALTTA